MKLIGFIVGCIAILVTAFVGIYESLLGLSPALNYIYFKYIKRYEKKN